MKIPAIFENCSPTLCFDTIQKYISRLYRGTYANYAMDKFFTISFVYLKRLSLKQSTMYLTRYLWSIRDKVKHACPTTTLLSQNETQDAQKDLTFSDLKNNLS